MYDELPIVDAHHHLWDLEGSLRYPWLQKPDPHHSYMGDNSAMRRTYLPPEYRRDTALTTSSPPCTSRPRATAANRSPRRAG